MEDYKLTKKNWMGLGTIGLILTLGIIGRVFEQEWAENIYLFITIITTIILGYSAGVKTKLRPIKEFIFALCINIFFCVGAGWWWIAGLWCVISICFGACMSNYISAAKEADKKEFD
jgi:hypothetical protein